MTMPTVEEEEHPTTRAEARAASETPTETSESGTSTVSEPPPEHDGAGERAPETPLAHKTLLQEINECLDYIDNTQVQRRKIVQDMQQVQCESKHGITTGDIFTATWNLNTKPLTPDVIAACFCHVLDTDPSIIVLACQEVDDLIGMRLMFPKVDQDIENVRNYFGESFTEHTSFSHSNQFLLVMWNPKRVYTPVIRKKKLFNNCLRTKGAMAIVLEYVSHHQPGSNRVCFIAAHLSAHADNRAFKHKPNLQKRITEMHDLLTECGRWHEHEFPSAAPPEHPFLPFNIILLGDLNFRMIFDSCETAMDEGQVVLKEFGFRENPITFRKTFKVEKHQNTEYNETRTSAWTDRIVYHQGDPSGSLITQKTYEILNTSQSISDHLPVCSQFDIRLPGPAL